jgi:diguanylate cyclase (GGDEF)-like protein
MASLPDPSRDESRRLAALRELALLDTAPEREFDALVALAAELAHVPSAMLTLVDADRQWVKARSGPGFSETPRDVSFCDHTIRGQGALVVEDAAADPRFSASPLVTGPLATRFYAGVPIHAPDAAGGRQPVGALCVTDTRPQRLSEAGSAALAHLATLAEALLAARAAAQQALAIAARCEEQADALARRDRTLMQAERLAGIGSWRYELATGRLDWSDGIYRLHGLPAGGRLTVEQALEHYPPASRERVVANLERTIATGEPYDVEEDFLTAQGELRRVRGQGEREMAGDVTVALVGVFQDVTDQHDLAQALRRTAETDPLTGIANRTAFNRALADAVARAHDGGTPLALAMVDLDGFKSVNDTLGHLAGDDVLHHVAAVLSRPWLGGGLAARLGGDEFALIVENPALAGTSDWRGALEDALRCPVSANGITLTASGTVGIAALRPGDAPRDLLARADALLYAGKRERVGDGARAVAPGDRRRGSRRAHEAA